MPLSSFHNSKNSRFARISRPVLLHLWQTRTNYFHTSIRARKCWIKWWSMLISNNIKETWLRLSRPILEILTCFFPDFNPESDQVALRLLSSTWWRACKVYRTRTWSTSRSQHRFSIIKASRPQFPSTNKLMAVILCKECKARTMRDSMIPLIWFRHPTRCNFHWTTRARLAFSRTSEEWVVRTCLAISCMAWWGTTR